MKKIVYVLWLLKEIAKSSLSITRLVWSWNLKLDPKMDWIFIKQKTDISRVIYANSITLTPGTVTVYVEEERMLVHSLEAQSLQELKSGYMEDKIC